MIISLRRVIEFFIVCETIGELVPRRVIHEEKEGVYSY